MKTTSKLLSVLLLGTLLLPAACVSDAFEPNENATLSIQPVMEGTKTNGSGFVNNDVIGLYVVSYTNGETPAALALTGNKADNAPFTYTQSGNSWSTVNAIQWENRDIRFNLYGYYPYAASVSSVTAYPVSVLTDQSTSANYYASDFLCATTTAIGPSSSAVPLTFNHRMSKITISIEEGLGFGVGEFVGTDIADVSLTNLKPSATVNLSTGTVTSTGSASAITPLSTTNTTFDAIVVPQTINSTTTLITFKYKSNTLTYKPTQLNYASGMHYTFKLALNKDLTILSVSNSVASWTEVEAENGQMEVS